MPSVQRSEFSLRASLNGGSTVLTPINVPAPSTPRILPKGANIGGAQVAIDLTLAVFGITTFAVVLQGTSEADPNDPSKPDANAAWIVATMPTTVFSATDNGPRMMNPAATGGDDNVSLAPFTFVRAVLTNITGSTFPPNSSNLIANVHVKLDYFTG